MGLSAHPGSLAICPQFGKDVLSRGRAKKLAKTMEKRRGNKMDAYECWCCGGWHVGMRRRFAN